MADRDDSAFGMKSRARPVSRGLATVLIAHLRRLGRGSAGGTIGLADGVAIRADQVRRFVTGEPCPPGAPQRVVRVPHGSGLLQARQGRQTGTPLLCGNVAAQCDPTNPDIGPGPLTRVLRSELDPGTGAPAGPYEVVGLTCFPDGIPQGKKTLGPGADHQGVQRDEVRQAADAPAAQGQRHPGHAAGVLRGRVAGRRIPAAGGRRGHPARLRRAHPPDPRALLLRLRRRDVVRPHRVHGRPLLRTATSPAPTTGPAPTARTSTSRTAESSA